MSENKKKKKKKNDETWTSEYRCFTLPTNNFCLLQKVLSSDLYLAIDLVLIDEQGRKVDLFGRVAACFICRGETSSEPGNVELLHPGGRGPFSSQVTKAGRKMERTEETTDECDSPLEATHSFSEKSYIANYTIPLERPWRYIRIDIVLFSRSLLCI